jgi:hypothetical protein
MGVPSNTASVSDMLRDVLYTIAWDARQWYIHRRAMEAMSKGGESAAVRTYHGQAIILG